MIRVIVTRPEPDATRFAAAVAAAGMTAILSPAMTVSLTLTAAQAADASACIFTSANGVRAYAAAVTVRDLPAVTVGEATARAARAAGFADVRVAGGDVHAVAALIAAQRDDVKLRRGLVHFGGEEIAGDLVAPLSALGFDIRRVCAYRAHAATELTPAARAALGGDSDGPVWVALFSARTAAIFLQLAENAGLSGRLPAVNAACLSEAVAASAGAQRWARVAVAQHADSAALLAVIANGG